ncbi:DUF2157 domain-containing protein [Nocardioides sp.]|uniref:DUF2157 domain-containing protein n=1 Tax=Nocardioides sp. TaxID=35761 RepID=UPI002736E502|nr:DUF2157 domain-containing protein [Nocardioides sp.]MDP3891882.1 DUF2157 domain-containing protein [Nocardioides sp.]
MTQTTPTDISPRQLAWLEAETSRWQRDGLVGADQSAAILASYHATNRFSLARLGLYLGGAFVGIGLLWLVAANLDQLPPLVRFLAITLLWLAAAVGAELIDWRRSATDKASPLVGAVRAVAALTFGAVIMQAAQSLQVPAYEPALVGLWGLGALIHAYAVRGVTPLVVGVTASTVWLVWHVAEGSESLFTAVLTVTLVAVVSAAAAALHEAGRWPTFAATWREYGAAITLGGLFVAALPIESGAITTGPLVLALLVVALLATGAALALGSGLSRWEPVGAAAAAALAAGLVIWDPGTDVDRVGALDWLHAGSAVGGYVLVAAAVAALGIVHDSPRLTWLAVAALVLFTTVQSFAVFAAIIEGAWLFVALGLVFLVTGYLADRARRGLTAALEGEEA